MRPPATFRRIPSDRLRRLRDRYGECLADPTAERCLGGDYARQVVAQVGATLRERGER